jgi:hypothetical protein
MRTVESVEAVPAVFVAILIIKAHRMSGLRAQKISRYEEEENTITFKVGPITF